jgi:hypothetical protein
MLRVGPGMEAGLLGVGLFVLGCTDDSASAPAAATLEDAGQDANLDAKPCPTPNTLWETATVASNEARHLALRNGRVFWTGGVFASDAQTPVGPVSIFSAAGGAAVEIFSGQRAIVALVADAQRVYWADRSDGTQARLLSIPHEGGEPAVLLSADVPFENLAVDETHLYATHTDLIRVPITGGAVETLAPDMHGRGHEGQTSGVAVDAEYVYYSSRRDFLGGDGSGMWFSDEGVFRRPRAGGARQRVAFDPSVPTVPPGLLDQPSRLSLHAGTLCHNRDFAMVCTKTTDLSFHFLALSVPRPPFAVFDGFLYFVTLPDYSAIRNCDLELRRIPAAGGAAETLVSGYDVIQDIEVDAESMYWIAGGRIQRSRR